MKNEIKIPGKVYRVGGAVRDAVMGREAADEDYVVVGASSQEMLDSGFSQVGADFPVFLHPVTGDEYALARTERKSGNGYLGFEVEATKETTLEEDLKRRDLTINAMAQAENGEIIDPYNGRKDIKDKLLRHVDDEAFAEDPLRILRVARFKARLGYTIYDGTLDLMRKIHDNGETKYLTKERIWKELSRALLEENGSQFFNTLQQVGIGKDLFPLIKGFNNDRSIEFTPSRVSSIAMDISLKNKGLETRIARWTLPNDETQVNKDNVIEMWKNNSATNEVLDRVAMTTDMWNMLAKASKKERSNANDLWYDMITKLDANRRPERWLHAYKDVRDQFNLLSNNPDFLPSLERVGGWIKGLAIDGGKIAQSVPKKDIKEAIENAKQNAWKEVVIKDKYDYPLLAETRKMTFKR